MGMLWIRNVSAWYGFGVIVWACRGCVLVVRTAILLEVVPKYEYGASLEQWRQSR